MRIWDQVAIVGVGLIGGSLGLALLRRKLAREVIGIGRQRSSLEAAERTGAITRSSLDLASGVQKASLVVVCTPVDLVAEHVQAVAAAARSGNCLITDAGSTKAEIVAAVERSARNGSWPAGTRFVGSHPLAGSEKRGAEHATEGLFEGRTVIVTPSETTSADDRKAIGELWTSVGARVIEMTPAEHDKAVAATSHLPHLVASAVAAATPDEYVTLTAGGWRDVTRIAAADPDLWQQIFMANRQNVLSSLEAFESAAAALRAAIENSDRAELKRLLARAKSKRDALGS